MEELSGKRRGRPRKVVDLPNAVEEGADASDNNNGDGQVSEVGDSAPAVDVRQGEEWDSFVAGIAAETYRPGSTIRVAYHPNPQADVIQGNWNVRVEKVI